MKSVYVVKCIIHYPDEFDEEFNVCCFTDEYCANKYIDIYVEKYDGKREYVVEELGLYDELYEEDGDI